MESVTLTTNGILLTEQLAELVRAGIDGVNISLDTLDRRRFMEIARRDKFEHVLEGIRFALTFPQLNVKINCVPRMDDPEDALAIADLAKDHKLSIRFIEMMPIGFGKPWSWRRISRLFAISWMSMVWWHLWPMVPYYPGRVVFLPDL